MKALQITKSVIQVSANPHVAGGMIAAHRFYGIGSGCRKVGELTEMIGYMSIAVHPVEGHSQFVSIHPDEWRELINESPVESSSIFPVTITPEIESWARAEALKICDCPAVRSGKDVHPDYAKNQRWGSYVRRATK